MGERGHAASLRLGDVSAETLQLSGRLAHSVGLEETDLSIAYVCLGVAQCDGSVQYSSAPPS